MTEFSITKIDNFIETAKLIEKSVINDGVLDLERRLIKKKKSLQKNIGDSDNINKVQIEKSKMI